MEQRKVPIPAKQSVIRQPIVRKELVQKKNGAEYIVSPWALTWDDENYYMVGYEEASGKIKHYRVDKMQEIRISWPDDVRDEYKQYLQEVINNQ